jgi:hypothetical protein
MWNPNRSNSQKKRVEWWSRQVFGAVSVRETKKENTKLIGKAICTFSKSQTKKKMLKNRAP